MEEIIITNNDEYQDIILQGIKKFNYVQRPKIEVFNTNRKNEYYNPINFYLLYNNQAVGGMLTFKTMQWLDVDVLFIKQEYRRKKLGSKLISKAIEYCKKEDIIGIHLFTLDFQAKGFYEKQGFKLIAEIKDWPKGVTRYEFIKYI